MIRFAKFYFYKLSQENIVLCGMFPDLAHLKGPTQIHVKTFPLAP